MNKEMTNEEQVKAISAKMEELRQLVSECCAISDVYVVIREDVYEQRICLHPEY